MFNSRYLLNKVVLCFLISLFCMFYAFSNLSLADDEGQVLNGNNTEESVGTDNNQNVNYEDDDIANIGLSINQLKELIAALEQKGDALNEEEKARIKDYKNIITCNRKLMFAFWIEQYRKHIDSKGIKKVWSR